MVLRIKRELLEARDMQLAVALVVLYVRETKERQMLSRVSSDGRAKIARATRITFGICHPRIETIAQVATTEARRRVAVNFCDASRDHGNVIRLRRVCHAIIVRKIDTRVSEAPQELLTASHGGILILQHDHDNALSYRDVKLSL